MCYLIIIQDINECSLGKCDPLVLCANTPGSYMCGDCPNGYSGDGYTGCKGIFNNDTVSISPLI